MENQFELDAEQIKIKNTIFPYLKALTYELAEIQPEQQEIKQYMIDFFSFHGNYTTSGLTKNEKKELEYLRLTVKHYRELEKHQLASFNDNNENIKEEPEKSEESSSEEKDDVMDAKEEEVINNKLINIKKSQVMKKSLISRISVSAEAYGMYNQKKKYVPKVVPKNEDQMNRIRGKIISSFIFSALDEKDLEVVINAMEEKKFKLNENVITQGEDGDCLYIVETGQLKCYKTFKSGSPPTFLKNYESGDSFGELALLYNCPRAATIVCSSEECILWSLDRETFNNIVKEAAQKKREKYESFLKKVNILSTIDSYELGQICDSLKDGIFKKDEYIIKEGELGDIFYILEEGQCNATKTLEPGKPETIINVLKEGDYFGERALIRGEPRYANIVVASETAKVISLDRRSFNRLLGPIIDILKRNMEKYQIYFSNNNEKADDVNNNINLNINHNEDKKHSISIVNNDTSNDESYDIKVPKIVIDISEQNNSNIENSNTNSIINNDKTDNDINLNENKNLEEIITADNKNNENNNENEINSNPINNAINLNNEINNNNIVLNVSENNNNTLNDIITPNENNNNIPIINNNESIKVEENNNNDQKEDVKINNNEEKKDEEKKMKKKKMKKKKMKKKRI